VPNLPALRLLADNSTPLEVTGPLVYGVPAGREHDYSGEIYTFEAAAGAATTLSTNTCLVIGGYYNGVLSYYRVDFAKSDGTYLPLLRNHSYNVKIKEVFAAGHASDTEAFDHEPSNTRVEISEDDGALGHVVFNGQNYLGASAGEITVPANARDGYRFTASTDVAAGWVITGTSGTGEPHAGFDVDWITGIAPLSGSATSVTFNAGENATGARRVAYIHLQAGLLHLAVKVTQLAVGIWITDENNAGEIQELVFNTELSTPVARQFLVHWIPAGAQVNSMSIPVSRRPVLTYDPSSDVPGEGALTGISGPPAEMLVDILPAPPTAQEIADNPFLERASLARFVAFHDGDFVSADVELRHANYHTLVDVNAFYLLDGGEHSFTVRSNTEWAVSAVDDPQSILQPGTTVEGSGGYNFTTGDKATFKLILGDISLMSGEITVTLTDPAGLVDNVTVTIKCMTCGGGGTAVSLPIGKKAGGYLTHVYGGKCWMVQNSEEGTEYKATYHGSPDRANGYYYSWAQANTPDNACPTGWHVPSRAEADDLKVFVLADKTNTGRWWTSATYGAFAGFCYAEGQPGDRWNTSANWWSSEAYWIFRSYSGIMDWTNESPRAMSVRCVYDE
jgi:uncharacterized protein (TIGR02145 family)